MSFRYKTALLSLSTLVLVYGWYFASWTVDGDDGGHAAGGLARLLATVFAIVVLETVGHIVIAVTSQDRHAAMDERERGFDRRATCAGYYLLLAGALLVVATAHLGARPVDMADAVLLAIVVAESVRQAVFLVLHHRSA